MYLSTSVPFLDRLLYPLEIIAIALGTDSATLARNSAKAEASLGEVISRISILAITSPNQDVVATAAVAFCMSG